MQEWKLSDIQSGIYEFLNGFDTLKVNVADLHLSTTDDHIFGVIGKNDAKKKVKPISLWEIKVDEDALFSIYKVNVLYGGKLIEQERFFIEEDTVDMENYNIAYANAVFDFEEKARNYNRNMDLKDEYGFYRRAFVVFERDNDLTPVVKWVIAEHLYFEDETIYREEDIENIREAQCIFEDCECDISDIYQIAYRWRTYDIPEHLTVAYVKADITYTPFDEEEKVYYIEKLYDGFGNFIKEVMTFKEEVETSNLKKRWQCVSGMDIDQMNELTEVFLMEHYFKYGLTKFNDEYKLNSCNIHWNYRKFLNMQENLEDYLKILTNLMTDCDVEKIRNAFLELKENPQVKALDIYKQFIEEYLGNGYEIGKVYLAEVETEHYLLFDEELEVSRVDFLDKAHYVELKKRILNKNEFKYVILRDVVFEKREEEPVKSYLMDNLYEEDGKRYIQGWVGDILPVRVIGFHKDGTPMTQYAKDWWSKR